MSPHLTVRRSRGDTPRLCGTLSPASTGAPPLQRFLRFPHNVGVGELAGEQFEERFFRPGPSGKSHLDVRAANVEQLRRAGVRDARIWDVSDCTSCRADLYHSYRREGRGGGRMINFVGFAGVG